MASHNPFRRTPIAAAVLVAMHAAGAHAQTENPEADTSRERELPKISVDAAADEPSYRAERAASPKFTQPLLDTPQTVTVIRKELIAEQGATNLSDALRNTPGITFQLGENGNTQSGDTIFMRGFDTQNSIFVDGIRDLGTAVRDVFNIEQIEIFKGPAGADNGRGATSGYVNLASKLPQADSFIGSSLAYGTEDRRRASADWNYDFGAQQGAAFRINAMVQDGGVAGRDFVERESYAIAPSFAAGLGTSTRFFAYSQHVRQDNIPDGAIPAFGVADHFLEVLANAGIQASRVDQKNFYGLDDDYEDIDADMFTIRLEHDFAEHLSVRNTSRYGKSEQERVLTAPTQAPTVADGGVLRDPSAWTVNRSRQASFRENEILTNQTNFTADFRTGGLEHSLSSGVEFIYEEQYTPTYVSASLGTAPPANLYNPDPNAPFTVAPNPTTNGAFTRGDTQTAAVYAFDTIKVGEKWEFTGGARWENYDTTFESVTASAAPVVLTPLRVEASDSISSWKVGALFKPVPQGSVYVAYADSLKPPGSDNFTLSTATTGNAALNNPNLDPQKATNIELGAKWEVLGGRLFTTAALFRSKNKNDLVRTDPGDPNAIDQYGEKTVEGLELGAVGKLTDAWQISAGLTRQNTEVEEGTATQQGAAINFSPKLTATLWTTYALPFGVTVGGGARYVDTQARQINNTPAPGGVFEVPDYTVVDLFASYNVTQNVGLQLNAYNVADKFYVAMINNSGQRYSAGTPRSYLLSVNFKF